MLDKIINNYTYEKKEDNDLIEKFNKYKYIFGLTSLIIGILFQLGFLFSFFNNLIAILYINIDFSIILIVFFFFILLLSFIFSGFFIYMIVITLFLYIGYSILNFFNINLGYFNILSFINNIFFLIIFFFVFIIYLFNYKKINNKIYGIKYLSKIITGILIILSFIFLYLTFRIDYQIEYKTKNQSGTGKVIFYNGENYFLETNEGKKIIPVKSIESINKIIFTQKINP